MCSVQSCLEDVVLRSILLNVNRAIENAIGPYYSYVRPQYVSKLSSSSNGSVERQRESAPELPKEVFRMLLCIGPYLHRNALLLQKVYELLTL